MPVARVEKLAGVSRARSQSVPAFKHDEHRVARALPGEAPSLSNTRRTPDLARGSSIALLLFGAVAAASLAQGGFFVRGQLAAAGLLAASVVAALPLRRTRAPELQLPLVAGGLLVGWILVRAVPSGSLVSAGRAAMLLTGLATVLVLCRRLNGTGRGLLLAGLLAVGALVALVGWFAVAWRLTPWALPSEGLWRAASTLTYANATAALLVPLALTAAALLSSRRRSLPLALLLTILLAGIAATLSRAGALALAVGLGVLLLIRGRTILRPLAASLAGATVAFLGLLPSLSTAAQPRSGLAVASLVGGVALTALLVRTSKRGRAAAAVAVALVLGLVVGGVVVGSNSFREVGARMWDQRVSLDSQSRSTATAGALQLVAEHPVAGVGPGRAVVWTRDSDGRLQVQQYIHNEYLQVIAELGAVGAVLLIALLVGVARLLRQSRPPASASALWAGVVAACTAAAVQAGFDFVWHVPAVPLAVAVLVGIAIAPAAREDRGPQHEGRSP